MKNKVYFEEADNVYYQIVEADSVRQARGPFASQCVREDDFTFIEAIKLIIGVELCGNQL